MGFSNYLRSLLGREASIVKPLVAFNLGLELGQLVIVSLILIGQLHGLLLTDWVPNATTGT